MPPDTIYVGRPTKHGNPFKLVGDIIYADAGNRRGKILDKWVFVTRGDVSELLRRYSLWLAWHSVQSDNHPGVSNLYNDGFMIKAPSLTEIKKELKGKNLACWCKEGEPCHADYLLTIANE